MGKFEEKLTETKLSYALHVRKNGSVPGPDSIPVEFYETFFLLDVKFLVMNSLHYSHAIGILSSTQKQGTINLIHKGNGGSER